jgi:hypothetical protein
MQQASSRRESNITSVARTITETRRAARKCARKIRLQRGSALSRTKCIPFTEQSLGSEMLRQGAQLSTLDDHERRSGERGGRGARL